QAGLAAAYPCVKAFSETDFRQDPKKFDGPTLVIHGEDEKVVPIAEGGDRASKKIDGAIHKVYQGAPHGLMNTHQQQFNADLLDFVRGTTGRPSEKAREAEERVAATTGPRMKR